MTKSARTYLPAAGRDLFLPLYDPIVKLLGGGAAREALLAQAGIRPTDRVFDLGCGTGTMAMAIQKQFAGVEIVGLDPDPRALARARKKAARESLTIQFDQGFGDQLPYPAASFDRALSSFMFHHPASSAFARSPEGQLCCERHRADEGCWIRRCGEGRTPE